MRLALIALWMGSILCSMSFAEEPAAPVPAAPAAPVPAAPAAPARPAVDPFAPGAPTAREPAAQPALDEARIRALIREELRAALAEERTAKEGWPPPVKLNPVRPNAAKPEAPAPAAEPDPDQPIPMTETAPAAPGARANLLGDDATTGTPTSVGPFGMSEWVTKTYYAIDRKKKTDQSPEKTAGKFADLYKSLLAEAETLANGGADLRLKYQTGRNAILEDLREEEAQASWQELLEKLQQKIDETKQTKKLEGKDFDPSKPVYVKTAIQEVASGFQKLAEELNLSTNLSPSYFQNPGSRSRGYSRAGTTTTSGGAPTIASVWHERQVNHIVHAHQRRSYRIERIQMRR